MASAGGEPELNFADADWARVERAYRVSLSEEVRGEIVKATTSFAYFEIFERTVEPLSWAADRVERVSKGITVLFKALLEDPRRGTDAHTYADHLIKRNFDDVRLKDSRDPIHDVVGIVSSLRVACNRALKEIGSPELSGHREGDCWDNWVIRLTGIAQSQGMPIGVRSDSDKNPGAPSPFVAFVNALQGCVAIEARRHTHSFEALAKAINRARRRRDTKPADKAGNTSRKAPRC